MKRIALLLISMFLLTALLPVMAHDMGNGWIPYHDVKVTWDGSSQYGDWHVYDPDGTYLYGCDDCLEMEYEFKCAGKTLQFDETYVEIVPAFPQTHHVVLHNDGTGTYTGLITARYEWPTPPYGPPTRRMDVIEYEIEVDENCLVTDFFYVSHEHKHKLDI